MDFRCERSMHSFSPFCQLSDGLGSPQGWFGHQAVCSDSWLYLPLLLWCESHVGELSQMVLSVFPQLLWAACKEICTAEARHSPKQSGFERCHHLLSYTVAWPLWGGRVRANRQGLNMSKLSPSKKVMANRDPHQPLSATELAWLANCCWPLLQRFWPTRCRSIQWSCDYESALCATIWVAPSPTVQLEIWFDHPRKQASGPPGLEARQVWRQVWHYHRSRQLPLWPRHFPMHRQWRQLWGGLRSIQNALVGVVPKAWF